MAPSCQTRSERERNLAKSRPALAHDPLEHNARPHLSLHVSFNLGAREDEYPNRGSVSAHDQLLVTVEGGRSDTTPAAQASLVANRFPVAVPDVKPEGRDDLWLRCLIGNRHTGVDVAPEDSKRVHADADPFDVGGLEGSELVRWLAQLRVCVEEVERHRR